MISYHELLNNTLALYMEEKYQKAYDYITKISCYDTPNEVQLYNFRYSILAVMNKTKEAISLFEEAIDEKGYWYSYDYLCSDDDLKEMRNDKTMQRLMEICKKREIDALKSSKPQLLYHTNRFDKALLVFHGNQENMMMMPDKWDINVFKQYDKLFVQSREIEASLSYNFNNPKQGVSDAFKLLQEHVLKSYDQYVVSGFSAGANVALQLALKDKLNIDQLILIAPWIPDLDLLKEDLIKLKDTHVVIIIGAEDTDCYNVSMELKKHLEQLNILHVVKVIPSMDHMYPDRLNAILSNINSL